MASWLMAVDRVGRHAGSWSYIQGSTRNHKDEGKSNNLGCMLYSVFACTRCQLMIMAWREGWLNFVFCNDGRVVDEKARDGEWRWERSGGYERICEIRGTTCLIGLGRPCMGGITCQIGTPTCRIGDGKLTHTRNSVKSQFLMMISPISSHVSPSRPQLYPHLRTRSWVIPLYLSMPWSWVNTEYSIHRVLHTQSTAYTEYCIIPRSTVSHSQPVSHLLGRPLLYSILYIPTITS